MRISQNLARLLIISYDIWLELAATALSFEWFCWNIQSCYLLLLTVFSLRAGRRRISPSIEVFFPAILFPTKIDRYFSGTSCTFFGIVFILVPYLIVCALARFSDLWNLWIVLSFFYCHVQPLTLTFNVMKAVSIW